LILTHLHSLQHLVAVAVASSPLIICNLVAVSAVISVVWFLLRSFCLYLTHSLSHSLSPSRKARFCLYLSLCCALQNEPLLSLLVQLEKLHKLSLRSISWIRASNSTGSSLILLVAAGRFKGKRGVFLNQLPYGLLLDTGTIDAKELNVAMRALRFEMTEEEVKVWRWKWMIAHESGDEWCLDARWRDRGSRVCIELGVQIESIRLWSESIRICTEAKTPQLKPIRGCGFESTSHSKFHELPRIESIRWVTEPIRFHPVFKFNVQNALRIDSSSSESILKKRDMVFKGFSKVSRGAGRANDSAYGNNGPSGVVSACGVLVSTWDKS
ncbi:hypothetical protein PIB30_079284, partial [Stylosanthes scabra]|nr:hypothetical protein [Stylosanthes scabra]